MDLPRKRKAVDWKPRLVIVTIPPSSQETVITIDVQPKRGRADMEVPDGTQLTIIKTRPLTQPNDSA